MADNMAENMVDVRVYLLNHPAACMHMELRIATCEPDALRDATDAIRIWRGTLQSAIACLQVRGRCWPVAVAPLGVFVD